ncbi:MAG TPA: glycosyltransferase [Solirubrobacteraceae bacterium]|nr:glycosyltransferase [Solirubrobacteraceae bacterium]
MDAPTLAVVVCTRDRPRQLARTLDALRRELDAIDELVVVDQSAEPLAPDAGVRVIADRGRGLSRARNLALARTSAAWLAFVDDDCRPERGWAQALRAEIAAHPEAAMVCPRVDPGPLPAGDYLEVTTFPVERAALRRGRRTHPARLGFGVFCVVRRDVAEALGGWDERLGPGAPHFPAADDMDFNFRVLRAGHAAWVTPRPRAVHDQWRRADELPALHRGYLAAWCGFAVKTLRTGAAADGARLLAIGIVDVADALADALRRPSRLYARLAAAKAAGFATGTVRGLLSRW